MLHRVFISILACCFIFAQRISPQSASQSAPANPEPVPNASQEAYIVERLSRRIDFQDDGTSTTAQAMRAKVQSDAGVKQLGLLVFQYLQPMTPSKFLRSES